VSPPRAPALRAGDDAGDVAVPAPVAARARAIMSFVPVHPGAPPGTAESPSPSVTTQVTRPLRN